MKPEAVQNLLRIGIGNQSNIIITNEIICQIIKQIINNSDIDIIKNGYVSSIICGILLASNSLIHHIGSFLLIKTKENSNGIISKLASYALVRLNRLYFYGLTREYIPCKKEIECFNKYKFFR